MDKNNEGFDTKLIHSGEVHDENGSPITPIYQTSTFVFETAEQGANLFKGTEQGYIYTRLSNPTVQALEDKLAELEGGVGAIALSSGMAAVTTAYISILKHGDHMVSSRNVYGASRVVMESIFADYGVESSYVDTTDLENIRSAIRPNTKMLYLESPSNPSIQLTDIRKAAEIGHQHNLIVVVDNTFSSPYLQKPLELGADISLHSLTKAINGHADTIGGALITNNELILKKLRKTMQLMGGNMDPHQAFMINRGLKTLSLRMERAQSNAKKIAEYLEQHGKVAWVSYPGLVSHPQKGLADEQMSGYGAMISFGLKEGFKGGEILLNNVKLVLLAVSLGGVETLIQHPASMTHAGLSAEARAAANITEDLIRLSVGIENVEDIMADLDQALAKVPTMVSESNW